MLKVVPAVPDKYCEVSFNDYAAWRKVLGLVVDDYWGKDGWPVGGLENEYVSQLLAPPGEYAGVPHVNAPFISGMQLYDRSDGKQSPIRAGNIGYGPLDVERAVWAVMEPWQMYEAISGHFDPAAVSWAADQYTDPNLRPEISTYKDVRMYSWSGEVNFNRSLAPPLFDKLGSGRTLAVQPTDIFASSQKEYVRGMVDASRGEVNSLADDPDFQLLAHNLDKKGVLSAEMCDAVMNPNNASTWLSYLGTDWAEFFRKAREGAPLMGPYSAFATGLGQDETGLFVILVLAYGSPAAAEQDAATLQTRLTAGRNSEDKPWTQEVLSSDVWVDGKALCAVLRGNVVTYWYRFAWGEPLLAREN